MSRWLHLGYRAARRVVVAVAGGTVVLLGVAMIALPGPALVVIPVGLAILGLEFAWARRWLRRLRETAAQAADAAARAAGSRSSAGANEPRQAGAESD